MSDAPTPGGPLDDPIHYVGHPLAPLVARCVCCSSWVLVQMHPIRTRAIPLEEAVALSLAGLLRISGIGACSECSDKAGRERARQPGGRFPWEDDPGFWSDPKSWCEPDA